MIDLTALKQFLLASNKPHTTGTAALESETDGSRTIMFKEGPWSMHDNFFGGEPYGGRQVVFYQDEPVWLCVYYGKVLNTEPGPEIYDFLRESLQHAPEDKPYRGPAGYTREEFEYANSVAGEGDGFSGHEEIYKAGVKMYEASYLGGLIDQRAKGSL